MRNTAGIGIRPSNKILLANFIHQPQAVQPLLDTDMRPIE
jgi:hypothetical protein